MLSPNNLTGDVAPAGGITSRSSAHPVSELFDRLQADATAARKAQDKALVLLLGTVLSEVKNRQLELNRVLTDDDVVEVLRRALKKRRESVDAFEKAQRLDLADKERMEAAALENYLPAGPSDDELRAAVRAAVAAGAGNLGAVMGRVMPQFKGRADGARLNAIAREELSRAG